MPNISTDSTPFPPFSPCNLLSKPICTSSTLSLKFYCFLHQICKKATDEIQVYVGLARSKNTFSFLTKLLSEKLKNKLSWELPSKQLNRPRSILTSVTVTCHCHFANAWGFDATKLCLSSDVE